VLAHVGAAGMLVFPSLCYEGFALAIAEALAQGVPVVGSRLGAQAEIVREGVSGLLFRAGDATTLRDAVRRLVDDEEFARQLSRGARTEFEKRFSPELSYRALIDVYQRVATSVTH
jgi:glycosyltransferase involved in cell wall biosynthesis